MKLALLASLSAFIAGCGVRHVPDGRLTASEAAVRGAREAGAEEHPEAAQFLRIAEDELQRARTRLREGERADAAWLLRRAEADADVAGGLAREAKAKAAADEASETLRRLSVPGLGVSPVRPLPEP